MSGSETFCGDIKTGERLVADLIPFARNSRTHSDEQVAQIAASIREFGWTNPILVDGENGIIAGEMTGRSVHAIELNPAYVDVAVLRWQQFTGKQAVHEDGTLFDDARAARNAKVAA